LIFNLIPSGSRFLFYDVNLFNFIRAEEWTLNLKGHKELLQGFKKGDGLNYRKNMLGEVDQKVRQGRRPGKGLLKIIQTRDKEILGLKL
jgi:hypothetical protein